MVYVASLTSTYAHRRAYEGGEIMDVKRYVEHLLEDLAHITSGDERDAFDPDWLRGYVAGMSSAAQYALEMENEKKDR